MADLRGHRPPSTAEMMREMAAWLDLADRAFEILAQQRGEPIETRGRSVQGDLMLLACWLDENPLTDARMYAVLEAVPAE